MFSDKSIEGIRDAILGRIEMYIGDIEFAEEQELTEDEKTIFESVKNIINEEFAKALERQEKKEAEHFKVEFELPIEFSKDFEDEEYMGAKNRMQDCFARIGAELKFGEKRMLLFTGTSLSKQHYGEINDALKECFSDAVVMADGESNKLKVSIELPSSYKKDFVEFGEGRSNVTDFLERAASEIRWGHMDIAGTYEREICEALRNAFLKVLIKPDKEKKIVRVRE